VEHVPQRLRAPSLPAVQRFGPPAASYRKLTFRKDDLKDDRNLDAELLSPGHRLFASTVDVLEEQLAHARQGVAAFVDPFSVEPYRLYFFEARVLGEVPEVLSAGSRTIAVHGALFVVAENDRGEFDLVAPDILHDLTAADKSQVSSTPAPDDVRRAGRWLQVNKTTDLVKELRQGRQRELEIRREYIERSFHELIKQRRNTWTTLASRVAGGDDQFKLARDEAQRLLEETERKRELKLAQLQHLEILRPGPAVYLGSAAVNPSSDREVSRIAHSDPKVERLAVEVAMQYERAQGWSPQYIGDDKDGSGFDIRSIGSINAEGVSQIRRIEVKGRADHEPTVMLSLNEWTQAGRHGETYWLYVVTDCSHDKPKLWRIRDPFDRLRRKVNRLTVVKGFVLPADAIQAAAEAGND